MADPERYQRDISAGLDRVYRDDVTPVQALDLRTARLVIFSDMHKGVRDGADDFLRCERAYSAALGSYLERGFRLVVLGDAEELWENRPDGVLAAYEDVLRLEAEFHRGGRYERIWGNHDDEWRYDSQVRKRLGRFFPGLRVREALKLRVHDGDAALPLGQLFLVHGHQGTLDSDRYSLLSRLAVRYVWRNFQRLARISLNTPSRDYALGALHDTAMFTWARGHADRPVLVAGHTHHPVFGTSRAPHGASRDIGQIEAELDAARRANPIDVDGVAELRADLEWARGEVRRRGRPSIPVVPPCYFNSGCCCFDDGDVTGIEIADGEIRLVRRPDEEGRPRPRVLERAELRAVLHAVAHTPR